MLGDNGCPGKFSPMLHVQTAQKLLILRFALLIIFLLYEGKGGGGGFGEGRKEGLNDENRAA